MPLPDHTAIWDSATEGCRAVRSMEFMLSVGGRANGSALRRTRMRGAVEGGGLRLEALAPFGASIFILVAPDERTATLLLPRDRQVVTGASPAVLLDALAGLELGPADVQALLTGCLAPGAPTVAARRLGDGWTVVELEGGTAAYLRDAPEGAGAGPVITAGQRDRLTVGYSDHVRGLPRALQIEVDAPPGGAGATELNGSLSQVNLNTALDPAVFQVDVPDAYTPATVEQLRGVPPLELPAEPEAQ